MSTTDLIKQLLLKWLDPKAILILVLTIIIIVGALAGRKYVNGITEEKNRIYTQLIGQQQAYKQLSASTASLQIQYQKEVDLRQEAETEFANEKSSLLSQIKVLSDATFLVRQAAQQDKTSEVVSAGIAGDGWVLNEIKYDNGPAIGYVLIQSDGKVTSKLYDHQIEVHTVVSRDEVSGKYSVISNADYVLKAIPVNTGGANWVNKPYALNITGGTALIDPTEPVVYKKEFHLWDPKVNINANVDTGGIYPGAGVSVMGYGDTPNDLDFKFLQVGGQINSQKFQPTFTPILWRPFHGLIDNTYVGPGVYYDQYVHYFLGIQVGL